MLNLNAMINRIVTMENDSEQKRKVVSLSAILFNNNQILNNFYYPILKGRQQ